uniref:Uncharacterized protein n=1 Tax=Plectus sambesii TaxID=2011161 RepID=A0A914VR39_9BILA
IGSNELTRPFRIPRLTRQDAKEETVKRRPQASKRPDVGRQSGLEQACRSPLAGPAKSRPTNDRTSSSYGQRIVPAVKRKATSSSELQDERRFKSGIPIDDIMQNMIMPTSKQAGDALSDADSARSLPRGE